MIHKFIQGYLPNQWINHPYIRVYVRKASRRLPGTTGFQQTFDVANIEVHHEYRGEGRFTEWLNTAEAEAKKNEFDAVFVESILEERLIPFLERRGYQHMPGSVPPSMYLMVNNV
jgi:N-acetylglutamate synthase-like GNAT family acetyltransferase